MACTKYPEYSLINLRLCASMYTCKRFHVEFYHNRENLCLLCIDIPKSTCMFP